MMYLRSLPVPAFLLFLLVGLPLRAQSGAGPSARVTVAESDRSGITLEIEGLRPVVKGASANSAGGLVHNAPDHLFRGDTNAIPELRFTLGIPAGAVGLRAEIIDPAPATNTFAVPVPAVARELPQVEVWSGAEMRGIRTAVLAYRPFNYQGGMISWRTDVRIRVTWDLPEGMPVGAKERPEIPAIEAGLRSAIINYDQAKEWKRGPERLRSGALLASANASGWGIGEEGLILSVPSTGIYRLTGAEFRAATGNGSAAVADLRLRNREIPVPFFLTDNGAQGVFDGDDVIEFRGDRNPGEPGIYMNEITDTNAYVLTWSGGEGEGPAPATTAAPPFNEIIESYDSTLHFEQEEYWFGGIKLPNARDGDERTLFVTERVSQERFYWRVATRTRLDPLEFNCSPHYAQDASVTMAVRIAGGIYSPVEDPGGGTPITQRLLVFVNGLQLADTISIVDTNDILASVTFPAYTLINGKNRVWFDLLPLQHPSGIPVITTDIRVDYLELKGRWKPVSTGGPVIFPASTAADAGVAVAGMTEAPERAITPEAARGADSLQRGYLFRLTSRNTVATRATSGFYGLVGGEQAASPGSFNLGITIMEVEPNGAGGRILRQEHFQTNVSESERDGRFNAAADFVNDVRAGNIVVAGLAYGTNWHQMTENFMREFESLGSRAVRSEDFFAAGWVFAARKGDPSTAVEAFSRNNNGVTLNAFIPDAAGNVWRGIIPASGPAGEQVLTGPTERPALRYHAGDELLAAENRADLIIITHPKFRAEAERLAQHRRDHNGYSVKVVDIYRIYDEFNHGNKEPVAIRRFLQYADTNWADPKPGFVVLFGDASWDGAQRMDQSIMVDYIPSSGVPSTDHIYTVAFGDTTLFPRQFLGRLPVSNDADARTVVDKIIEYDMQPPARWNKKFVFATGGQNISERNKLRDVSLGYALMLSGYPFFGEATVISRSGDSDDDLRFPSTVDGEAVRNEVNKGALWLDFNGHGATTTLDLNYGFPEDFDNGDKYFILATWSCQTGLFSDPTAALRNERFVTIPGKGTVASIGGTSFSFTNIDNIIRNYLYGMIADPTGDRNLGRLFMMSKYDMFAYNGFGSLDNNSVRSRNHVMTYNLLGDPSMDIAVRRTPELALPQESTILTTDRNSPPDLGDSIVVVRSELWNYGGPLRGAPYDSGVAVTATLLNEGGEEITRIDTVRRLDRFQELEFRLPLSQEPGEYVLRLVADPQEAADETYRGDNVLTLSFLLRGAQPLPLEPLSYAALPGYDDITIRLLNPQSGPGAEFLIDTVPTFDSPGRFGSGQGGSVKETELTTEWTFSVPQELRAASTFWWKAVSTSADPEAAEKFPLIESFTVKPAPANAAVTLRGLRQMEETRLFDLVNRPEGVGPGTRQVPIEIVAVGQSFYDTNGIDRLLLDGQFLSVLIDGKDYRVDPRDGLNLLVLPPNDVVPLVDTAFALYDFALNPGLDDLETLVANIVPGQKVLVATSGGSFQVDGRYENGRQRLIDALRSLGGSVDTLLGSEDTYILIGGKDLPADQVKELWIQARPLQRMGQNPPFTGTLRDTITAVPKAGLWVSPVFGPAVAWRRGTFDLDPASDGPLDVAVVGLRRDGLRDTVLHAVVAPANPVLDLAGVDLLTYPRIEFAARFVNDTAQRLRAVDVDFDPSPELAIVPSTFRITPDSVLQGDPVTVHATIANLTSWEGAENIFASFVSTGEGAGVAADTVTVARIAPLDSVRIALSVNTTRIRFDRPYVLLVNPADVPSEPYVHNNRLVPPPLRVTGDLVPPGFALYADDNRLMNGDYTSPVPTLEVRVFDNSLLSLDSISTVTLVLDNRWITAEEGGTFETAAKGDLRALFRYTPEEPLEDGPHDLLVYVRDASGNGDTSEIITFYVEKDLTLRNAVNWPNPFAKETSFTFTITGEMQPESGEIAVFTAAGRKIKTIRLGPADLNVGFNSVEWDGLDEDRDRLANGVYFYRVKIRAGDVTTEVIEKLVVLR